VNNERDHRLAALAATKHGIFGRAELREIGFTRHQGERRTGDARWIELYEGVYRIAGTPQTWRGNLLAAVLAGGPQAVASHRSGAALRDLPGGARTLQELMCPRWPSTFHEGLIVH